MAAGGFLSFVEALGFQALEDAVSMRRFFGSGGTGLLAAVVALAAGGFALTPAGVVATEPVLLEIVPRAVDLGRLNPVDPLDSEIQFGRTTVRIFSATDWQLEIALASPICRTADGWELPHPDPGVTTIIPSALFALEPCVVASGDSSASWVAHRLDWVEIGTCLETLLRPESPPGTYAATMLVRLLDTSGSPLLDPIAVAVEFSVAPWVRISDEVPLIEITVDDGEWNGASEGVPTSLFVSGNTAWRLGAAQAGDVISDLGLAGIPDPNITALVPPTELPPGTPAMSLGEQVLGPDPIILAEGDPGTSPSAMVVELPVVIRLESDQPLPAGSYRAELVFEVDVHQPLP